MDWVEELMATKRRKKARKKGGCWSRQGAVVSIQLAVSRVAAARIEIGFPRECPRAATGEYVHGSREKFSLSSVIPGKYSVGLSTRRVSRS